MAGSGNISKQVGGPIKADEIKWQGVQKKDDGAAAALATALGGGVTKPTPVAFPWTIYTVSSTEDDDKPGLYCLAIIDVPKDTMGLKVKGCYVKNNGAYGRVKWFPSYRLDDTERAAGRVEIQLGPFRPNSRFDIVRLVAVKRQAKDVGNPALGADDRRGKGTTPAYTPPALPAWTAPYADQIPGDGLGPLTMGTILTGDYIVGSPRVLRVSTPKTEVDGIYYPVDIGTTGGAEALMISVRFGVYRVGTKVGGTNAYSKRIVIPRYELTEEDRETLIAGSALTVDVGPFKANKRYHIKWVRARYSLDPDDSGAKVVRQRHPAAVIVAGVDETQNYDANDAVDGQGNTHTKDILDATINVPGGGSETPPDNNPKPYLATLVPTGDITNPPSDPNSSDIITNEPDDATEKDKDAIIVLRVWAAEANRALYLINPSDPAMTSFEEANVNRVAVVIKTLLPDGVTYKQRRHGIDIEDPSAYFVDIAFHRQIGKPLVWVKNVSLNEADRDFSSTIDLAFTAGSGDGSEIDATFVLDVVGDADDNRQADATVSWTNGATPAIPKKLVILRAKANPAGALPSTTADKLNGNADWKVVFKKNLRADSKELAAVSSAVTQSYTIPGVTSATGTRTYLAYLWIVGNPDPVADDTDSDPGGAGSDGISDAEAPSAPGTPTLRFRHGHLRVKCTRPTDADGNRTIYQYEWQFCSTSAFTVGGGRTFLQDDDTTPFTTASAATILSTGNKLSIPIKRKDFIDFPWSGSNICVRVRAYNSSTADTYGAGAGVGDLSGTLTHGIGTAGASLDDPEDTAVPGSPTFGRAKFKHGNLRVRCIRPATQFNTIFAYHWIVSNSSNPADTSADFLQDSASGLEIVEATGDPTTATNLIKTGGPVLVLPVKKSTLTGLGATIYVHVIAENLVGATPLASAATLSITTASLISGVYNDDEEIPLRRTFHGRRNLWEGGDCQHSAVTWNTDPDNPTTAITQLGRNVRLTPGGTRVTTTSTASNIIWNQILHCIEVGPPNDGGGISFAAVTFVGRIKKSMSVGETYALSLEARMANTILVSGTSMSAVLVDASGTTISNTCTWTMGGISATNFQTYAGMVFTVSTNTTGAVWLRITTFSVAENNHLLLDRFCLVRGSQSQLWEPTDKEVNNEPAAGVVTTSNGIVATELGVGFGNDGYNANGGRFTA